jgi:phage/plasmid primase-like uncharacterized protein
MGVIDFNEWMRKSSPSGLTCAPWPEVLAAAYEDCAAMDLGRPEIVPDGTVQRFALPGETGGKKSGWAIAWSDGVSAVVVSSWKTGDTVKVTGADERFRGRAAARPVSQEEIEANRRRMEEAQARREEERRQADAQAVAQAQADYGMAQPASPDNAYLQKKGVPPLGMAKQEADGTLLVPLYGADGGLAGVQRIAPDGSKKFPFGLAKKGRYAFVGNGNGDLSSMLVCEGYATGGSLHMATGLPVLCAMDAGNVIPACETWLAARPGTKFIFCADNDRWTQRKGVPWNPGVEAMQKAAAKFGGTVCIPDFQSLDGNPTDFNDLAVREGLQAVKAVVMPDGEAAPLARSWDVAEFEGQAPAQEWLVEGTLPMDAPCLLAAAGGTGKGMLELDLCLRVAGGEASGIDFNRDAGWLGKRVCQSGKAVMFTAEDNRDDVHRRLQSIDPDGSRRSRAKGKMFVVPLPDDGGPFPIVRAKDGWHQGFETTPQFDSIVRQCRALGGVKLVVLDPLASFVAVDVNADPQAGAFVQGALARLAKQAGGACVLMAHHMKKAGKDAERTPEAAREGIRGTTALVDGVRLAYAVWPADGTARKKAAKALNRAVSIHDVFYSGVVKSNCPSDNAVQILVRNPNGLLEAATPMDDSCAPQDALDVLEAAVRIKCAEGKPLAASGMNGLFARRDELPEPLCGWTKHRLEDGVQELLRKKRIVRCQIGKTAKWLDVPDGPMATSPDSYEFTEGSTSGARVPDPGTGKEGTEW